MSLNKPPNAIFNFFPFDSSGAREPILPLPTLVPNVVSPSCLIPSFPQFRGSKCGQRAENVSYKLVPLDGHIESRNLPIGLASLTFLGRNNFPSSGFMTPRDRFPWFHQKITSDLIATALYTMSSSCHEVNIPVRNGRTLQRAIETSRTITRKAEDSARIS